MRVALPLALILWLFSIPVAQAAYTVSTEEQAWAKCWDLKATKSGGYYNTAEWSCKFNGNDAIILYNVNTLGTADTVRFSTACEYGRDEDGCSGPEPEVCYELGQVYDPATEQCTLNCPNGQMDGQCLNPPQECTPDRPDYMGRIGAGNVAICEDDISSCGDAGTFGIVNGTGTCISNDYGPPTLCPPGSISRFDGYGFTCDSLPEGTENPQWADGPPNVDTNGDGAPDAYDPRQDPASAYNAIKNIFNQNSVVINQNNITNNNLTSIDNAIKQGNSENAANLEGIAGALGDLASGIGGMASDLGALKQMGENGELAGGGGSGDGTTEIVGEDGNAITWSGESINTELTDPTESYDQVMADYQAKINQIKGEVQAMFSTSLTGGGSVDDNIKSIHGVDVNFSLNRFLSGLDILGAIVLFCAAFISAGILFSGRG